MRILMVGAGAIGGYFGARLASAGRDVTFLVRPGRAELLRNGGLRVKSPAGDVEIAHPRLVTAEALREEFELVVLTCKAYDLSAALADIAPAVGANTAILPLLNGMAHIDALDVAFGANRVLGGQCVIASTLADDGTILHLNAQQSLSFGERDGSMPARAQAIATAFKDAAFPFTLSDRIVADMWEKWMFLASLAASTSLMRAPVGAIVAAPGGPEFMLALAEECRAIAAGEGFAPRDDAVARVQGMLTTPNSPLTASMMRDIEKGGRIEADHVIGDLLARGRARAPAAERPLLSLAYTALKAYEVRRAAM